MGQLMGLVTSVGDTKTLEGGLFVRDLRLSLKGLKKGKTIVYGLYLSAFGDVAQALGEVKIGQPLLVNAELTGIFKDGAYRNSLRVRTFAIPNLSDGMAVTQVDGRAVLNVGLNVFEEAVTVTKVLGEMGRDGVLYEVKTLSQKPQTLVMETWGLNPLRVGAQASVYGSIYVKQVAEMLTEDSSRHTRLRVTQITPFTAFEAADLSDEVDTELPAPPPVMGGSLLSQASPDEPTFSPDVLRELGIEV